MSLLINPMAVIFVAKGHGLMAVINPRINAAITGKSVPSSSSVRNSINPFKWFL
jgi:hypothetical protein